MNRIPLHVVQESPPPVECTECGKCCTYVGIEIDRPTRVRYATDILWYLYHENVYIYVDGDNDWSLHFETRCRNLGDDLLCKVYEQRPHICREFDNETCEVNDHDHENLVFRDPESFVVWLAENKPGVFKRLRKKGFLPPSLAPLKAAGRGKKGKGGRKGRDEKRRKGA